MYLNHYNLKEMPFDINPGPRFFWLGSKYAKALATLKYGISANKGFLLLTADVGMGKTALIHRLINSIDVTTIFANIPDPELDILDFFKILAVEFKMAGTFNSKGEFLIQLQEFLYKNYADDKKVLLIIDEAQRLNNDLLEQIRLLSNIEKGDRKLINIFFVGQTEFNQMLTTRRNRAVRQRIAINLHLDLLTENETGQYIQHRLKVAGCDWKIFTADAIREIFRFSKGCPRLINVICDRALLMGYVSGVRFIDSNVIEECKRELEIPVDVDSTANVVPIPADSNLPQPHTILPRKFISGDQLALIGIIIVGAIVSYLFFNSGYWPKARWSIQKLIPQLIPKPSNLETGAAVEEAVKIDKLNARGHHQELSEPEPNITQADRKISIPQEESAIIDVLNEPAHQKGSSESQSKITQADRKISIPQEESAIIDALNEPAHQKASSELQSNIIQTDQKISTSEIDVAQQELDIADLKMNNFQDQDTAGKDELFDFSKIDIDKALSYEKEANLIALTGVPDAQLKPDAEEVLSQNSGTGQEDTAGSDSDNKIRSSTASSESESVASPSIPESEVVDSSPKGDIQGREKKKPQTEKVASQIPPRPTGNAKAKPAESAKAKSAIKTSPGQPKGDAISALLAQKAISDAGQKRSSKSVEKKPAEDNLNIAHADIAQSSEKKLEIGNLEDRLLSFLDNYCNTYAAKDLDSFSRLFSPDAKENGKPFASLLSIYQKNFNSIDTIRYSINLQQYSHDSETESVRVEGNFWLEWLPYNKKWRKNSGKIYMNLKINGPKFIVQRLDYHGNRRKKKSDSASR